MEVSNVKYDEILKLIGNIYTSHININKSADTHSPFIKETILKLSDSDIKDVDFGYKDSNYNINKSSFTDLVREAIYCKIANIELDANIGIDNTRKNKGYLKIVRSSAATPTANNIEIEANPNIIQNIICSMNLLNIFIDILDAYDKFLINPANVNYLNQNINKIILVNKYAKKRDDIGSTENLGYFMQAESNTANKPVESALYLSINCYSGTTDTNRILQDYITSYNIGGSALTNGVSSDSLVSGTFNIDNEVGATGLFDDSNEILDNDGDSNVDVIAGIVIGKSTTGGEPVIKKFTNTATNNDINLSLISNLIITGTTLKGVLLIRDKRLFEDFLNLIMSLDLTNRQTQIKGLLIYFKVIKEYFHMSLTTCNLLYNSYFLQNTLSDPNVSSDMTTFSSNQGYAIKYLNNDIITLNSNAIYSSGGRLTSGNIIELALGSGGDLYENSAYGSARKENDNVYMKNIIESISELQSTGAENANISKSSTADISDKGFVAIVNNKDTIRIKSRASLLNSIILANTSSGNGPNLNTLMYITGNDATSNSISSDNTFKIDTLTNSASNLPEKVKKFLRNTDTIQLSKDYVIRINNISYSIKRIIDAGSGYFEFEIKARLIYATNNPQNLNDIPVLTLPHNKYTLIDENEEYLGSGTSSAGNAMPNKYFRSLEDARSKYVFFHGIAQQEYGVDNKVILSIKKPLDYKSGYLENISNIKSTNYEINQSESKIKNSKTIYSLNKSKNDILYYQLMSYVVILTSIIVALILAYTMNMPKPIIKLVASVCFGIVVLQVITYYILNILYIESFTVGGIEKFENPYDIQRPATIGTSHDEFDTELKSYISGKIAHANNQLILVNNKIIQALELSIVGVSQGSSTEAYTKLMDITEFERKSRNNIGNILKIESEGTEVHIDLLKYKTTLYAVNIKTVLMLSLIIVGLFTINIYTDNKYMENIAFIGIFALTVILSYYLIYSNSVVRTRSNNFYWGKEHKKN